MSLLQTSINTTLTIHAEGPNTTRQTLEGQIRIKVFAVRPRDMALLGQGMCAGAAYVGMQMLGLAAPCFLWCAYRGGEGGMGQGPPFGCRSALCLQGAMLQLWSPHCPCPRTTAVPTPCPHAMTCHVPLCCAMLCAGGRIR